jgi:hypothetical protein
MSGALFQFRRHQSINLWDVENATMTCRCPPLLMPNWNCFALIRVKFFFVNQSTFSRGEIMYVWYCSIFVPFAFKKAAHCDKSASTVKREITYFFFLVVLLNGLLVPAIRTIFRNHEGKGRGRGTSVSTVGCCRTLDNCCGNIRKKT